MINSQYPHSFRIGERKVLFQQEKQQEKHHSQQKIMGMETDEEYTKALAEYAAENDFSTPEEVEETYYKEDLVEQFLRDKAYDMIVDSMIVKRPSFTYIPVSLRNIQ